MKTTVVCREVRPAIGNSTSCVVIASQDEQVSFRALDPMTAGNLAEVRDRLHAQGIVVGGPLEPASRSSTSSSLASPVQISARDEHGKERRLIADRLEECSLSSASTLYYLYVPVSPCDCRWLVGRTLEIAEPGSRQKGIIEPDAAGIGGRDAGFVADRILEALQSEGLGDAVC